MIPSPITALSQQRNQLEAAVFTGNMPSEHALELSQTLDRLINRMMLVRCGRFVRAPLRAVRKRPIRRALP